jgi:hypothetical protein
MVGLKGTVLTRPDPGQTRTQMAPSARLLLLPA